ncbi:MAG: hypothetical protein Rhims3KO_36670 [Hyphomicrobiales bacterium]
MFSRMRNHGNVADEHVAKFVNYFSQPEYEPGFRNEVAETRSRFLLQLDSALPLHVPQAKLLSDFNSQSEFYVFEAAFLWHDQPPPPANAHVLLMSHEIAQTKEMLHSCIDAGKLVTSQESKALGGVSRIVSRADLKEFARSVGMRPQFLFPQSYQTPQQMERSRKKLLEELPKMLAVVSVRIDDWSEQDSRNVWAVFEVAFLWHGFQPSSLPSHRKAMSKEVEQTKYMLHNAIDAEELFAVREVQTLAGATRYLQREELRRFANTIGQRPRFLFPEDDSKKS